MVLPVSTNAVREMSDDTPAAVSLPISALSANICAELAAGLSDPEGIKRRYELTENEWQRLKASPLFRAMLKEAIIRLHGDLNAGKRITMKAEVALEDSIPLLHNWAHDPNVAIGNRLDAVKQMTVLAGKAGKDPVPGGGGSNGGGFRVNIVIQGNGESREVIDVTSSPSLEAMPEVVED